MYIKRTYFDHRSNCNYRVLFLAFFWIVGLLMGTISAIVYSRNSTIMIACSQSFFHIFLVNTASIILCCLALCKLFVLLYPIILGKAICFGFSSAVLIIGYGDCGWLVRCLVMLAGVCSACVLWFYLLNQLQDVHTKPAKGLAFSLPVLAAITFIDSYVIVPFVKKFLLYL